MAIITGQIYCPLCEDPMGHTRVSYHGKILRLFFCRPDKIGIFEIDPAFNKWRDADKNIPCPACGCDKIKWFARYMDGYFKGICPKCKTILEKDGDVQFKKDGAIFIPEEMEHEQEETPVEVKIPLTHLIKKFGKDKLDAYKNKLKRNRDAKRD